MWPSPVIFLLNWQVYKTEIVEIRNFISLVLIFDDNLTCYAFNVNLEFEKVLKIWSLKFKLVEMSNHLNWCDIKMLSWNWSSVWLI
jgi:hypothetical protein